MKQIIFILLWIVFGSLLAPGKIQADPFAWSLSTSIDSTRLSLENVTTCYDILNNRVMASWVDLDTFFPMYSIYENSVWSSPRPIDSNQIATGLRNVYLSYDTQNSRIFAVWNDTSGSDFYPTYSVFSNGIWSTPVVISTNAPLIGGDVFICYNSTNNQLISTWGSNVGTPTYSIYTNGLWSAPAPIAVGGVVGLNVYTCFNSLLNQIIATWADVNNGGLPACSIFSAGVWSLPLNIGVTGSTDNVFPCYNSLTNEVFATWIDIANNSFPTYSIFNGLVWSNPALIAPIIADGVIATVFSCYDSLHDQIFAAWSNTPLCDPIYSIYSNGTWSSPAFINVEPPGVFGDVYLTYDFVNDRVFATWTDCVTDFPFYSIYADLQPIMPPSNLIGAKRANSFATQTEWANLLSWNTPTSGATPIAYEIYRENLNTLIGIVPAVSALQFIDHNRRKTQAETYYVISVSINGGRSLPSTIIIK